MDSTSSSFRVSAIFSSLIPHFQAPIISPRSSSDREVILLFSNNVNNSLTEKHKGFKLFSRFTCMNLTYLLLLVNELTNGSLTITCKYFVKKQIVYLRLLLYNKK